MTRYCLRNENTAMSAIHSLLRMLLIIPQIFASQNIIYFKGIEGESVVFVCEPEEAGGHPIGLYLNRKCVGPEKEVMFFSKDGKEVLDSEDAERVQVHGDLSTNSINVTVSQLQHKDSGLYFCVFVYSGEPTDRHIAGKEDFFLFVDSMKVSEDFQCSCPKYPPLLYAISAAVGLLLFILLGLAASHCGKSCKRSRPQTPVPIYEEMIGGQPAGRKGAHCHLDPFHQEEADSSVYVNPNVKPRQENHYVSPKEKQLEDRTTAMKDN